jgi:hypothetical protein
MSLLQEIEKHGLADCEFNRGLKMDRFDYYMEFMSMRLDDPDFSLMYGVNEYDRWYSDYMEILSQKHSEPMEENKP